MCMCPLCPCPCPNIMCEFPISAPGVLHLATLLIGTVCVTLGFMTHLHSSWVNKEQYRLCQSAPVEHAWKSSDVECPDIALETAFLVMTCICLFSSFLWYCAHLCCFGTSKTANLVYIIYLLTAALALIIAGSLYIHSARLISNLPAVDYAPVVRNLGRVLLAALRNDVADDIKLTEQSDEQTYYQEKLATGAVTIINGVLHIFCAWLAVLDIRT